VFLQIFIGRLLEKHSKLIVFLAITLCLISNPISWAGFHYNKLWLAYIGQMLYGLGFQNIMNAQINYVDNHFRENNKLTISMGMRDLLQSLQLGLDFAIAPMIFESSGKSLGAIF